MYIVVTGAAGFIGSNLVKALNARGDYEVLAIDDLKQGDKFVNLADCDIADYIDRDAFLRRLDEGTFDEEILMVTHVHFLKLGQQKDLLMAVMHVKFMRTDHLHVERIL